MGAFGKFSCQWEYMRTYPKASGLSW